MSRIKKWNIKETKRQEAEYLAEKLQVSPLITSILLNRGFSDATDMQEFLFGKKTPYSDPFLMKDLKKAAERIITAIQKKEKIAVFGDYDVDGITASSLMYLFLSKTGADVITYIPKRKEEGYGLNSEALQSLADSGITLIITVDCGISGVKEVAEAPESLEIIITDHHRVPEVMPDAFALVNPHRSDCAYPFEDFSGVGVAFKLCQGIYKILHPKEPLWEKYTELVALGTVADIVPLRDENRELVKKGLAAMKDTELYGLQELIRVSACDASSVSSEDIGFRLAPRLNAVGRLEHAQRAVELFVAKDRETAKEIAEELNTENLARQQISSTIQKEAEEMLAKEEKIETAIVLASEGWHPGVIGIVASRLVDKYHLPTILLSIDGETAKGSCRSIKSLDLYDAINACSADLIQFGGHRQAAGLTAEKSRVDDFRRHFKEAVDERLAPEDYLPELDVDVLMGEGDFIDIDLLEDLQLLEPCGCENSAPVFSLKNVSMMRPRRVGKDDKHLQFYLADGNPSYQCIMWNSGEFYPGVFDGMKVDAAFKPKINEFRGKRSVNLQVLSFISHNDIYDFRNAAGDKGEILQNLARTRACLPVFIGRKSLQKKYAGQLQEMQDKGAIKLFYYEDFEDDKDYENYAEGEMLVRGADENYAERMAFVSGKKGKTSCGTAFMDRLFCELPENAEGEKEAVLFDIPEESLAAEARTEEYSEALLTAADSEKRHKSEKFTKRSDRKDKRLFLLYNREDYNLLLSLLEEEYPGRRSLAQVYLKLKQILKDRAFISEAELKEISDLESSAGDIQSKQAGKGVKKDAKEDVEKGVEEDVKKDIKEDVEDESLSPLLAAALEIFTELGFFRREGDKIMMGSSEKRDLMESETFAELFRKKNVLAANVKENLDILQKDILL